ncbi:MAG TPA: hypothetical protein P5216_01040, partial [Bacteroidota bacterium]|nr:hypothetical protein [Bacteroidota bacterium]
MSQEEIDALINSGSDEEQQVQEEQKAALQQSQLRSTKSDEKSEKTSPKLELLLDLQLPVSIELGRTN